MVLVLVSLSTLQLESLAVNSAAERSQSSLHVVKDASLEGGWQIGPHYLWDLGQVHGGVRLWGGGGVVGWVCTDWLVINRFG